MTRVLFVDQTAELGGAELCLLDLLRGRRDTQDRVVLFQAGPLQQTLEAEGVDVVVSPLAASVAEVRKEGGLASQLAALRGTQRQVKRLQSLAEGIDAIYANTAKALVIASLAFRNRPQPLIYHLHDIVTADHFSRANRWALVTLANCYAARVIANSQATADAFVEAGGKSSLVEVIPNGFAIEPFDRAIAEGEVSRRAARAALDAAANGSTARGVVAVFGRLAPWKGQDVVLRAVAELAGVELWIVGEALFGEEDYASELRTLASELGIASRVRFLGFRDDVFALMQQADVVVHASKSPEPFGRVVVEGMLNARPTVASRGGGVLEIIDHEQTGLLTTMGDAHELAAAIQRLLDNPAFAQQLATRAAEVARGRYAIEACVARTNEIIREVVDEAGVRC